MHINFYPHGLEKAIFLLSFITFTFFLLICMLAFLKSYNVFLSRKRNTHFKKKIKRLLSEKLANITFREIGRVVKNEIRFMSLDRISSFCDMIAQSKLDSRRKDFIFKKIGESDKIKHWIALLKFAAFKWKRILVFEILSKTKSDTDFKYIKSFL